MGLELYEGRVALVTGASSGFGAAIVQALQRNGLIVVGVARRVEMIQALDQPDAPTRLYAQKCDVTNEEEIVATCKWVRENLGGIDVLVNNAGLLVDEDLTEAETSGWRTVLETNFLAYQIFIREAVKDMTERGINGYIINTCSIAGHIPAYSSSFAMYAASKYAVKVLTDGLRMELRDSQSKIRNSQISPGIANTGIWDHGKIFNKDFLKTVPVLEPEDIAGMVIYLLSTPLRVQIQDIIVRPTGTASY